MKRAADITSADHGRQINVNGTSGILGAHGLVTRGHNKGKIELTICDRKFGKRGFVQLYVDANQTV